MKRLSLVCAGFLLCTPLAAFAQSSSTPPPQVAPSPAELLSGWLERLSLSAENACVAGLSADAMAVFIAHAESVHQTVAASLAAADLELAAARTEVQAQAALADITAEQRAVAVATAKSRVQQAQQAVDGILSAAHEQTIANLSADMQAVLRTLRLNSGRTVPTAYAVIDRTPVQWASLQRALRDKRVKESLDQAAETSTTSVIADADADARVVAAKSHLVNASAIRAAWQVAIVSATSQ